LTQIEEKFKERKLVSSVFDKRQYSPGQSIE